MGRTSKFRGRSRTHGRGKKAGRGAGKRGGKGMAGSAKHNKMFINKYFKNYFGKHGFKRHPSLVKHSRTINVGELQLRWKKLEKAGAITKGDPQVIDLGVAGYDKLLGNGSIGIPVKVSVSAASEGAIAKIENAGGEVEINA